MTVTTGCQRPSLVEMIREIRRPAALPPWVRPTATFSSTNLLNTNPSTTLAAWVDKAAQMSLGRKSLTLMPRGSARAQPPLPAATMPGTICNACQVVLIFDAELSPRTFCTFRRDLSSVPRTVSHWRTARDVLEGLSGVNERRMIIPMTTTGRRQQRYDHRLRDLVQGTGT